MPGKNTQTASLDLEPIATLLLAQLEKAEKTDFYVAVSGGLDSCVLLHIVAQIARQHHLQLTVLHFDHALQTQSAEWSLFCQKLAQQRYQLPFLTTRKPVQVDASQGLESSARAARYRWFKQVCQPQETDVACSQSVLLTAHHGNDQAETVLLNLLRGSGVAGLRGIARHKQQDGYTLCRPLLEVTRQDIVEYAEMHQLEWIEDPSNTNQHYRRNALRAQLLPVLQKIKPDAVKQFVKSADHMASAQRLLTQLAEQDLLTIAQTPLCVLDHSYAINLLDLKQLGVVQGHDRQLNVLRHWLLQCGYPANSQQDLLLLLSWINQGTADKNELRNGQRVYRTYREQLFVMPLNTSAPQTAWPSRVWQDLQQPLYLPELNCYLRCLDQKKSHKYQKVTLFFGDQARQHQSMKKLFQSAAVPHWRRAITPVLFASDDFLAIAGSQRYQWLDCVAEL